MAGLDGGAVADCGALTGLDGGAVVGLDHGSVVRICWSLVSIVPPQKKNFIGNMSGHGVT